MHQYFIKIPWWLKKAFPRYIWSIAAKEKVVYLTFDDGPHPQITPWVLAQLKSVNAKATFFCIGKNVVEHAAVYEQIINEGHSVGNHTFNHSNGWKTSKEIYLADIKQAAAVINSNLFRPPYGRMRAGIIKALRSILGAHTKIIMWDVLSADFDQSFSPAQCLQFVLKNIHPGAIVVFHDSEKAQKNLSFVLPRVLKELKEKGYQCAALEATGMSVNN